MKARVRLSGDIVDVMEYHDEAEPMFQYKEHKDYGTNLKFNRNELQFIDENDWDTFLKETSAKILTGMISAKVSNQNYEVDLEEETIRKFATMSVKYTSALIDELKKKYR